MINKNVVGQDFDNTMANWLLLDDVGCYFNIKYQLTR